MTILEDELTAGNIINLYMWEMMKDSGHQEWTVGNDFPFYPSEEQPEATQTSNPFVVYNSEYSGTDEIYFLHQEEMYWMVKSKRLTQFNYMLNMSRRFMGQFNDSSDKINKWIRNLDESVYGQDYTSAIKSFNFAYLKLASAEGPSPATEEAGMRDGLIVIEYKFVKDYN